MLTRHWFAVTLSIFAVLILLLSNYTGLVRGASIPTVEITGLKPVTIIAGQTVKLQFNISGGLVDSTHPWTLYWFFGATNDTAINYLRQTIVAPSGCGLTQNCSASSKGSIFWTYFQTGTYDVSVTAYDANFDYHIQTDVINVTDPVSMCTSPARTTGIIGQVFNFTAAAGSATEDGAAFQYLWNFGDGSSSTGSKMSSTANCSNDGWKDFTTHAFAQPGTHLVTVTATDGHGASSRGYIFVNVSDPGPTMANISVPINATVGFPINMSANATDPSLWDLGNLTFAWNFGDGSGWTISKPTLQCFNGTCWDHDPVSHSYPVVAIGPNTVTVEVYNPEGNASLHPYSGRNAFLTAGISILNYAHFKIRWPVTSISSGSLTSTCVAPYHACPVYPWWFYANSTYVSPGGSSQGYAGQFESWKYGLQNVSVFLNGSGSQERASAHGLIDFQDTKPIVGVTGLYLAPNITLSISGGGSGPAGAGLLCPYSVIQVNLTGARGNAIANESLPCGNTSVSLPVKWLYLGNPYLVNVDYLGVGSTGSTSVGLALTFPGDPVPVTYSWTFSNNNPATWLWTEDAMAASLGQPTNVQTEAFSHSDVALTVNWTFGDGTSFSSVFPAPVAPGPNLATVTVSHSWATGKNYPLLVTVTDPSIGGQGGLRAQDLIEISESFDASANDTAPTPNLVIPTRGATEASLSLWDNATNVDSTAPLKNESWNFGNGATASGAHPHYFFPYGGKYYVVATATSAGGSQGVAMVPITIANPPPIAKLTCLPPVAVVGQTIQFSAAYATYQSPNVVYAWNFGDGTPIQSTQTGTNSHLYYQQGTYTVSVTVTDPDNASSVASCQVKVNPIGSSSPPAPGVTLADSVVRTDNFSPFNVTLLSGLGATGLAFLNVTWIWPGYGGLPVNPNGTHGIEAGHTFLFVGKYTLQAMVADPFFLGPTLVDLSANVSVYDSAPQVSLPYYEAKVYGENHTSNLTAVGLGSWSDSLSSLEWNFTFVWGDGAQSSTFANGETARLSHNYTEDGPVAFTVRATTPERAPYAATGSADVTLSLVPDWDGDGLPNSYETLISHTSMYYDNTSLKEGSVGTGLTDFLSELTRGKLTKLSRDQDGDGLTDAQEIEGTVTGYFSNPLDANTAGDGVPDGAHFFTDEFRATEVVPLSTTGSTVISIPNVLYGGDPGGFNQSVLTIELTPANGNPSNIPLADLTLSVSPGNGTKWIPLGSPTNLTPSYYILNRTPVYGEQSPVYAGNALGIWLPYLQVEHDWQVEVSVKSGTQVLGNVTFAALRDSYYTNPSLADPYRQGMLAGSTLTTPVFNCSAPENESFPYMNWTTPSLAYEDYWPYTEAYYKLSLMQGVPYVAGVNQNLTRGNNESADSCNNTVSSSHLHDVASYLGDSDFGISPWNAYVAGDSALTNGMKALGKTSYAATAWKYESESGSMVRTPGSDPYPTDNASYNGPLNPTALSTAGDGVPDSIAAFPLGPPVLDVTIHNATDQQCEGTLSDQVGAYVIGMNQEAYTPVNDTGKGGSYNQNSSCYYNSFYSYEDHYVLPLNGNYSAFNVEFDLINDGGVYPQATATITLNGSLSNTKLFWTPSWSPINASYQVTTMQRAPTIFANTTQELANLPGYGYRYQGDPQFYAFYVNSTVNIPKDNVTILGGGQGTLNVIMESRQAFLNSTLGRDQENSTNSIPACLKPLMRLTVRNDTPSETGVAGTYSLNFTSNNASCGRQLLDSLLARSWNGSTSKLIGTLTSLNSTQLELLGLNRQSLELAPFETTEFDSSLGPFPTGNNQTRCSNAICLIEETFTSVVVGSLVAFGDFVVHLPQYSVEFGQWVLGLILHAPQEAAAAAQAAWNGLKQLEATLLASASSLIAGITGPIVRAIDNYELSVRSSLMAEILADRHHKPVTGSMELSFWVNVTGGLFPLVVEVLNGVLEAVTIVAALGLGFDFIVPMLITDLLSQSDQSHGVGVKTLHLLAIPTASTLVPTVEAGLNTTFGPPSTNNGSGTHPSQTELWAVMGLDWVNLPVDLLALSGAILLLGSILKGKASGSVGWATVGVVLGGLALVQDAEQLSNSSYCGLSGLSLLYALLGFGLGYQATESGAGLSGQIAMATTAMAAGVSGYEYSQGC